MLKDLKNSLLVKDFAFKKKRGGGRKLGEVRGNMVCLSVILSFEFNWWTDRWTNATDQWTHMNEWE